MNLKFKNKKIRFRLSTDLEEVLADSKCMVFKYTAYINENYNNVPVFWEEEGELMRVDYTKENVEKYINNGTWIVML